MEGCFGTFGAIAQLAKVGSWGQVSTSGHHLSSLIFFDLPGTKWQLFPPDILSQQWKKEPLIDLEEREIKPGYTGEPSTLAFGWDSNT